MSALAPFQVLHEPKISCCLPSYPDPESIPAGPQESLLDHLRQLPLTPSTSARTSPALTVNLALSLLVKPAILG